MEINKEKLLISHLRQNARKNLTAISRSTGIPVSTLFEKIKQLERGVIKKHTALLDFSRLGFDVRVNFALKAGKQARDRVKEFLMKDARVNSVYRVNNGYDFFVECIFRSMKEASDFSEKLEELKVKEVKEYYILDELKKEEFMGDPVLTDMMG
ncbi:MAG: Lrp/AsnC family transcriptional regulator [Candidatus Woesearchaeota archaeon]